jgi:hypothetical protein
VISVTTIWRVGGTCECFKKITPSPTPPHGKINMMINEGYDYNHNNSVVSTVYPQIERDTKL